MACDGISIESMRARLFGGETETEICCGRDWEEEVGLIEPDSVRFLDVRVGVWLSSSSSSSSLSSSERALKSQGRLVSRSPSNWTRSAGERGEGGETYPHGAFDDGDDIV